MLIYILRIQPLYNIKHFFVMRLWRLYKFERLWSHRRNIPWRWLKRANKFLTNSVTIRRLVFSTHIETRFIQVLSHGMLHWYALLTKHSYGFMTVLLAKNVASFSILILDRRAYPKNSILFHTYYIGYRTLACSCL